MSLSLKPSLGNLPFVFGQPNALADGGSLVALDFRFYVSRMSICCGSSGEPVAVDLVAESGVPEPYGVHLFNAEDADSATLRLLAPSGRYTGSSFALGIKFTCNQQASSIVGSAHRRFADDLAAYGGLLVLALRGAVHRRR